jgi:hypothetical protein
MSLFSCQLNSRSEMSLQRIHLDWTMKRGTHWCPGMEFPLD